MGEAENALYVHLAEDGGIFAVWGDTGRQAWITEGTLDLELERLKERGGELLYSRGAPDRDQRRSSSGRSGGSSKRSRRRSGSWPSRIRTLAFAEARRR